MDEVCHTDVMAYLGAWNAFSRRIGRSTAMFIAALLVFGIGWVGYVARYGECDTYSKFCIINVAGTRSEIGFEWGTPSLYISTHPAD